MAIAGIILGIFDMFLFIVIIVSWGFIIKQAMPISPTIPPPGMEIPPPPPPSF